MSRRFRQPAPVTQPPSGGGDSSAQTQKPLTPSPESALRGGSRAERLRRIRERQEAREAARGPKLPQHLHALLEQLRAESAEETHIHSSIYWAQVD